MTPLLRAALTGALLITVTTQARAQDQGVQVPAQRGAVISANPLGFLQFGPTLEGELPVGSRAGLMVGIRMPSMGLVSHALDSDLESGWMLAGSVRIYGTGSRRPAGWFYGPRFEIGKTDSGTFTSTPSGGGLELGHRWIRPSGFAVSVGGIAGYLNSSSENKAGYNDQIASIKGAFIMGVVNLGWATR